MNKEGNNRYKWCSLIPIYIYKDEKKFNKLPQNPEIK